MSRLADTTTIKQFFEPIEENIENGIMPLSMNVYPNPNKFETEFSIEINGIEETNQVISVSIINILGERIYNTAIFTKEESTLVLKPKMIINKGIYEIETILSGKTLRKKFLVN